MMHRVPFFMGMVFLLVACAGQSIKPANKYSLSAMQYLSTQTNWQFQGRLVIAAKDRSLSASINWRHRQGNDVIELHGPLGQGAVSIAVTVGQVTVDDGHHRIFYAGAADRILSRYFGVFVPLPALRYWVLGLVAPQREYRETGRGFIQQQWRVDYRQMGLYQGHLLPHKMTIEKPKTKIKLVMDQWKLG